MVAGLGWGPLAASIGGIGAATGLGLIFGMPYLAAFVVTVALPAWWLSHLALLGRPATEGAPASTGTGAIAPQIEWYPVGRLLLWIAGFAALTTMAALLTLGTDGASIMGALKRGLLRIMGPRDGKPGSGDVDALIDALVMIALGLAIGFRANVWNIGAEGQYIMGAIAGTGVALATHGMTGWWILPVMALAGEI
eukprot:gene67354-92280_t